MLHLGDHLRTRTVIDSISEEKHTGLGVGHFVTTRVEYETTDGEPVGRMLFRILKFKPGTGRSAAPSDERDAAAAAPPRADPGQRVLLRGRQAAPAAHPALRRLRPAAAPAPAPLPASAARYEWTAQEASGRGTVYSFVVNHYPQVPAFDYPLAVGLIELEEGTRLVADLVGIDAADVRIGHAGRGRVARPRPRPHPARVQAEGRAEPWTSSSATSRSRSETSPSRSSRARSARAGQGRSRPPTTGSTGSCGRPLADANLLGLCLPEDVGGSGLGMSELCLMLEQQGRVVAPVPLWATVVLGALAVAELGTPEQRPGLAPRRGGRRRRCSPPRSPSPATNDPRRPSARPTRRVELAARRARRRRPAAHVAARVLVPARHRHRRRLVAPRRPRRGPARTCEPGRRRPTASSRPTSASTARRAAAAARSTPAAGRRWPWMRRTGALGLCALQLGVAEEPRSAGRRVHVAAAPVRQAALDLPGDAPAPPTATSRPRRIRVTMQQAAWRLDAGRDATARRRGRQVVGVRRRPAGRARHPAPPRRARRRRRLPRAPLLPVGQADRRHPRRRSAQLARLGETLAGAAR